MGWMEEVRSRIGHAHQPMGTYGRQRYKPGTYVHVVYAYIVGRISLNVAPKYRLRLSLYYLRAKITVL